MHKTETLFSKLTGWKQKFYVDEYSVHKDAFNVSLSIDLPNNFLQTLMITVVYWDGGEKKIIKDFAIKSTSVDFTIYNQTSVPPFILYLETQHTLEPIAVDIIYEKRLSIATISYEDYDYLDISSASFPATSSLGELAVSGNRQGILPQNLQASFSSAKVMRSPLTLDLDGNGVETVSVNDGVYFDHDGNGFAEKSGWVSKDDAILVRDLNNNGQIDDGSELFGDQTILSDGTKAANGFEALAA